MREGIIAVTVAAVGKPDICPLVFQGRFRIDVDDAAHRVTTVERPLRTAQHLDPVHLVEIEIESRFFEIGDTVHIKPDRGSVDFRSDPADIDRRGQFRSVVRHKEVRDKGTELFDPRDVPVLDRRPRHGRCRQGFQPEVALLLERLHDHFVQFDIADLRRIFFYLFPSCRIGEAEQHREAV